MTRYEVLEIVEKIYNVCEAQEDCFGCPFEDTFENSNRGGLCLITSLLDDACVKNEDKYKQVKQESQKLEGQNPNEFFKSLNQLGAMNDNINHPKHYCKGGIEGIEAIKAAVSNLSGFEAVCVANIIKYMWRYKEKNGLEDVMKAAKYLEWLQEEVKHEQGLDRK